MSDQRISAVHERHSGRRLLSHSCKIVPMDVHITEDTEVERPPKADLDTITEIRSLVTHLPQLFIGVLQPARSSGSLHDSLSSCVYSVVQSHHNRQHDEPQPHEPQLNPIYGTGSGGRFNRENVIELTPKLVSRCVLCPVYIGCCNAGGITGADMETHSCSSLVLPSDVPAQPRRPC